MRLRATFAKTEAMRYTGHLDLFRTLERSMRRANLPLAYSQGFRPHARINLASALPLGVTSKGEMAEFWLKEQLPLAQIEAALQKASPPGIRFASLEEVEARAPKVQTLVDSAEYLAEFAQPVPDLAARVSQLLAAEELPRQRMKKGKRTTYDLRPLVEDLQLLDADLGGDQRLHMRLAAREGATGRPDEVLAALEVDPHSARATRTAIHLRA